MRNSDTKSVAVADLPYQGEPLKSHLIRGVLGTGGLSVIEKGLSLLIAVILARFLGADGYGYYSFAGAIVTIIAIPAQLGLPQLVMREVAASHAREEWSLMLGMRKKAFQFIIGAVVPITIVVGGCVLLFSDHIAAIDTLTFLFALVLLPVSVTLALIQSLLRALRFMVQATWPTAVLRPLVLVGLLAWMIVTEKSLQPSTAMLASVVASIAALGVVSFLLSRFWPDECSAVPPSYNTRVWIGSLLPFGLLAGVGIIIQKTDIVMLGFLMSPEDVGIYQIVVQGGMLVTFSLVIINGVLAPNIARLYVQQDFKKLQRLMTMSTMIMLGLGVLIMLVFVLAGKSILVNIFGEEYIGGYYPLLIFSAGQLISVGMGPVGLYLSMTGYERVIVKAISFSAFINIILNIILIPLFGLIGAATATAISVIILKIIMAIQFKYKLGLVFGPFLMHSK